MGKVFVECFENITTVESINLGDNRLTDTGISTSIHFIHSLKNLHELDLSDNCTGLVRYLYYVFSASSVSSYYIGL